MRNVDHENTKDENAKESVEIPFRAFEFRVFVIRILEFKLRLDPNLGIGYTARVTDDGDTTSPQVPSRCTR
jgi:hypothetical protein